MIRDNYKPHKWLSYDKQKYINEWKIDSKYFLENGYYKWMADCIFEHITPRNILDIGCGTGNGLVELIRNGNIQSIICIEENEYCIDCAIKNIEHQDIEISFLTRNTPSINKDGIYKNNYTDIDDISDNGITIIQGDILNDEILKKYLTRKKFDAITCWLLGTHQSTANNIDIINARVTDNKMLRLLTQNYIYELADIVLNDNGILQIVDRGETPYNDEIKREYFDSHKDQASVTSLNVIEIQYKEYEMIRDGICMVSSGFELGKRKSIPKGSSLISVISKK